MTPRLRLEFAGRRRREWLAPALWCVVVAAGLVLVYLAGRL